MSTFNGPATDQGARALIEDLQLREVLGRPHEFALLHAPEMEAS
ncbi:MAG: hypothetical protein QOJ80_543 [Mycobacterium sp.]|jgi:hypothetical protein|nr:hypothetical protein [Mycobacterium sp.]